VFLVRAKSDNNMTRGEVGEDEENPPFLDYETISRPRRIALFVEPSPFA
jgi:sulfoquinovosyltransferase